VDANANAPLGFVFDAPCGQRRRRNVHDVETHALRNAALVMSESR
jgi:hypothetical protein